jgi:hypothetical protein
MIGYRVEQTISALRDSGLRRTLVLIRERLKKEGGARVPIHERFWMSRNGFKPISYTLYGFSNKDKLWRANYLSDRGGTILARVNCEAGQFLRNKLVFHRLLERIPRGFEVPKLKAVIRNGRLISASHPHEVASLAAVFEGTDAVFVKPIDGARGHGVRLLMREEANSGCSIPTYDGGRKELLVVERVTQAAYSASIAPDSSNTVRVVSMRHPESRKVFIPVAVHRFGTRRTAPLDSFASGAVSCAIDVGTGRLGPGLRHPSQTGWKMLSCPAHPDTGAGLEGKVVPHWQKLLDNVMELMGIFPDLEFAAWDMLPVDDGWCVIEGNDTMGVDVLQVHGGLLADDRIRQFMAYHCPAALSAAGT